MENRPMKHRQPGLFDVEERAAQLTKIGAPLVGLKALIDWEAFRPELNRGAWKGQKKSGGRKAIRCGADVQDFGAPTPEKLSNDGIEYQIRDRFSFMRFLSL